MAKGVIDPQSVKDQLSALEEKHSQERKEALAKALKPLDDQLIFHREQVRILEKLRADLTGKRMSGGDGMGKRSRMSAEDAKALAEEIVAFVQKKKDVSRGDINAAFPAAAGIQGNLASWVDSKGGGKIKIDKSGGPRNTRYTA